MLTPIPARAQEGIEKVVKHGRIKLLEDFRNNIKAAADTGWKNVICMAGDRKGFSDEEGMDNCEMILREAVKIAEDRGVVICMELLNSKVNHPGYMCDHSAWGFHEYTPIHDPIRSLRQAVETCDV